MVIISGRWLRRISKSCISLFSFFLTQKRCMAIFIIYFSRVDGVMGIDLNYSSVKDHCTRVVAAAPFIAKNKQNCYQKKNSWIDQYTCTQNITHTQKDESESDLQQMTRRDFHETLLRKDAEECTMSIFIKEWQIGMFIHVTLYTHTYVNTNILIGPTQENIGQHSLIISNVHKSKY